MLRCLYSLTAGDAVPVQLDAGSDEYAGEAVDAANSMAQRSHTSRLMRVAAEDGIISPPEFH